MLHRDYFMRQMEQAIRLLQMALGLIRWQDYPEALNMIDEGFEQFFGFDSKFINAMPLEYLLGMLQQGETLDVDGCLLMGRLLKAEGQVYEAAGDDERAYYRYERALRLILAVLESKQTHNCPADWADVDDMVERLAQFQLPIDLQERLFGYYNGQKRYADAEDIFWQWVEAGEFDPHIVETGQTFYQTLVTLSDDVLLAGGLSRSEVLAGLEELGP